jgi:hypothetical protein
MHSVEWEQTVSQRDVTAPRVNIRISQGLRNFLLVESSRVGDVIIQIKFRLLRPSMQRSNLLPEDIAYSLHLVHFDYIFLIYKQRL